MLRRQPIAPTPAPVRGRVFIRKNRCKGCQFCIEFCPQNVLTMSKDYNVKGYKYPVVVKDVCINCTLCLSICPDYAILSLRLPPEAQAASTNAKSESNPASPATSCGKCDSK